MLLENGERCSKLAPKVLDVLLLSYVLDLTLMNDRVEALELLLRLERVSNETLGVENRSEHASERLRLLVLHHAQMLRRDAQNDAVVIGDEHVGGKHLSGENVIVYERAARVRANANPPTIILGLQMSETPRSSGRG